MGKYLGLPKHFGRRKKDVFVGIVDKIQQKAMSWSSRFLSKAGKQVLLKAVLTSLPSYAMSCFQLPPSLCKKIQSVLTRFWWDDTPNKKKICWVSWDKLTLPYSEGGLGFRETMEFNNSLLAKLSWRMINEPNSLLTKILKGKYFPTSSFMEATEHSEPSHGWISIFAGRDVLKNGMGWLVGDGKDINMWGDAWLSVSSHVRLIGPPSLEALSLIFKYYIN